MIDDLYLNDRLYNCARKGVHGSRMSGLFSTQRSHYTDVGWEGATMLLLDKPDATDKELMQAALDAALEDRRTHFQTHGLDGGAEHARFAMYWADDAEEDSGRSAKHNMPAPDGWCDRYAMSQIWDDLPAEAQDVLRVAQDALGDAQGGILPGMARRMGCSPSHAARQLDAARRAFLGRWFGDETVPAKLALPKARALGKAVDEACDTPLRNRKGELDGRYCARNMGHNGGHLTRDALDRKKLAQRVRNHVTEVPQ